jgi:hypothetical protein
MSSICLLYHQKTLQTLQSCPLEPVLVGQNSSSDGEINEEAADDITEETAEEVIEEVNDDVPFELVDDDGGNAEVIESPVRPRRSGRERQATRRSLDYHKEMRKGR